MIATSAASAAHPKAIMMIMSTVSAMPPRNACNNHNKRDTRVMVAQKALAWWGIQACRRKRFTG